MQKLLRVHIYEDDGKLIVLVADDPRSERDTPLDMVRWRGYVGVPHEHKAYKQQYHRLPISWDVSYAGPNLWIGAYIRADPDVWWFGWSDFDRLSIYPRTIEVALSRTLEMARRIEGWEPA